MQLNATDKESLIGIAELTSAETQETYGEFQFRGESVRFAIVDEFSLWRGQRVRYIFRPKSTNQYYSAIGRFCCLACGRLRDIEWSESVKET